MKYLICNLKAHKKFHEMETYCHALKTIEFKNINFILAPSNIYLSIFKDTNISLCTQDISLNNDLKLTGDTSIEALKSLKVKYAIIGHYERRKYYHEDDLTILNKINYALKNNLKIIYCIGENLEDLINNTEYQTLEKQLARVLNNVPSEKFKNIIIAYEPTYLIGSNQKLDISKITTTINFLKKLINDYYHQNIKVVFGGNINSKNILKLKNIQNIDGFIVGSSSLDIKKLKNIIKNLD